MWSITGPHTGQSAICDGILRSLPDWFGIEEAIVQYVREVADLPVFLATDGDGVVAGLLSVRRHFAHAAEIHLIAVRSAHHRTGAGRALVARAEEWLRAQGVEYLQVKTLSPSRACEHYERTRRFYDALAFRPLEEFPTLWGERNPCLQMVKRISPGMKA
jgi:GNAT superfamily N-acetyltransferase